MGLYAIEINLLRKQMIRDLENMNLKNEDGKYIPINKKT